MKRIMIVNMLVIWGLGGFIFGCSKSDGDGESITDTDGDTETDTDADSDTDSDSDTDTNSDSDTDTDSDSDTDTDTGTDTDDDTDRPLLRDILFTESMEAFPNPERGFHKFNSLIGPGGLGTMRAADYTLIYGRIIASDYRNAEFSTSFLNSIQAGFDAVRNAGLKVNPRVVYTESTSEPDAPLAIVLRHIEQLAPLWKANKDVINVLDPGFIGAWGEWHSSSNNLDSEENMNTIMDALLGALPPDRMMLVRQPMFKRRYLSTAWDTTAVLTGAKAFDESPIARIGHLNDCFLSSDSDVGTYTNWDLETELDYLEAESRFVPWGGETCAVHSRNDCTNALAEMEKIHVNYLNRDYNTDVIDKWILEGCYDEIELRLGYRFVLTGAKIADALKPGGTMSLSFSVKNAGFGELFNPRNIEIVLVNNTTGEERAAILSTDPRYFGAGETTTVSVDLRIPITMKEAQYTVGIRLPDISSSINDDYRYAIRFANENTWDETTGINILKRDLQIDSSAPGNANNSYLEFSEI